MSGGKLIGHYPCIKCDSSDAMVIYEQPGGTYDGHCYSCESHIYPKELTDWNEIKEEQEEAVGLENKKIRDFTLEEIEGLPIKALDDRGLPEYASEFYGVRVAFDESTGEISHHFYPLTRDGKIIGYKIRDVKAKDFLSVPAGKTRDSELFGQYVTSASGRMVVVVEGECDALAAYSLFKSVGKDYRVVSLTNGASIRSAKKNLEYLESFETVIICLDQDKQGKKASKEIAELLTPGRAKIMTLSEKDPNDMLVAGKEREFYKSLLSSREYRPDGIVRLSDSWNELFKKDNVKSIPYPWDGVNEKLYGMRPGELVTFTSGTGQGKSAIVRELTHYIGKQTDDNVGILALEENIGRTSWGLMSIEANLPLHIREERERRGITKEQLRSWYDATVGTGRVIAYDHFGSTSEDNLIHQVRYLIKGMDCKWIFLDHLSIVVSSMEDGGDERRTIDSIMTRLRTLVEETGAGVFLVSHLRRMSGDKGHEQGGEVSLNQLRGSHSISQLSDAVIGLERNQQADNEKEANLTKVRVLKNRYAGLTGIATHLYYNRETGRLEEVSNVEEFLDDEEGF
jgi:twinkle protein